MFASLQPYPTTLQVTSTAVLVVSLLGSVFAAPSGSNTVRHVRQPRQSTGFVDPTKNGNGSWFLDAGNGLGEPLNVVISSNSSPEVLTDAGFLNYARSFYFSSTCLGIQDPNPFTANLGDGNGPVDQVTVIRQDYENVNIGTCIESVLGGNHFRVFRQNGTEAPTEALFLAVSYEQSLLQHHTISADGYNKGRDDLVKAATGTTSFGGVTYQTSAELISQVVTAGSEKVNHGIAFDGNVYILTVMVTGNPSSS